MRSSGSTGRGRGPKSRGDRASLASVLRFPSVPAQTHAAALALETQAARELERATRAPAQEREGALEVRARKIAARTRCAQRVPHEAARQGLGQRRHPLASEAPALALAGEPHPRLRCDARLDPLRFPALCFGQIADRPEPTRIECLAEAPQEVPAQPRAGVSGVAVRGVLSPGETPAGREAFDLGPRDPQQRTYHASVRRALGDAAEPGGAGAP